MAGAIRYAMREAGNDATAGDWVALLSGANINFDRLGHIFERCALGEGTEALLVVTIPERAGSFLEFLTVLAGRWSISLFHYRNHAAANARILAGFLVPQVDEDAFHQFLEETGYPFIDETENVACLEFLSAPVPVKETLKAAAV